MTGAPLSDDNRANVAVDQSYNRVSERCTDADEVDLVGMVAHALYKRQKRDWLVRYRADHEGRMPSGDEVNAPTSAYLADDLRLTLYLRAGDMLNDYAEDFVESAEPRIREQAISFETLRQARDIERSIVQNSGVARQVGTGLVATALWTLLVLAVVLTVSALGSDILDAWSWLDGRAG